MRNENKIQRTAPNVIMPLHIGPHLRKFSFYSIIIPLVHVAVGLGVGLFQTKTGALHIWGGGRAPTAVDAFALDAAGIPAQVRANDELCVCVRMCLCVCVYIVYVCMWYYFFAGGHV